MVEIQVVSVKKDWISLDCGKEMFNIISELLVNENVCLDFKETNFTTLFLNELFRLLYDKFDESVIEKSLAFINMDGYDPSRIQCHQKKLKYDIEYRKRWEEIWAKELLDDPDSWGEGMKEIYLTRTNQKDLSFVGKEVVSYKCQFDYRTLTLYITQSGKYLIHMSTQTSDYTIVIDNLLDKKIFDFVGFSSEAKEFYKKCGIEFVEYI